MKTPAGARVLIPLAILTCLSACRPYPTKPAIAPKNRAPVITSMVAFPQFISQGDSVLVTVSASDPDGDTLRYDWMTDARLHIPGDTWNGGYLNNTRSNSLMLYRTTVTPINDSAWVYCDVRDTRGGGADQHVFIRLRN